MTNVETTPTVDPGSRDDCDSPGASSPTHPEPSLLAPLDGIDPCDRLRLHLFVLERAARTRRALGFGWVGREEAPCTYQQLRGAFRHSEVTGEPLPVLSRFCDNTIFLTPKGNMAFRYWHDTSHIRLGLSFKAEDELELALWHLGELAKAGYAEDTGIYRLFAHDLFGNILLNNLAGRFPHDQGQFASDCAKYGVYWALLHEIRRVS